MMCLWKKIFLAWIGKLTEMCWPRSDSEVLKISRFQTTGLFLLRKDHVRSGVWRCCYPNCEFSWACKSGTNVSARWDFPTSYHKGSDNGRKFSLSELSRSNISSAFTEKAPTDILSKDGEIFLTRVSFEHWESPVDQAVWEGSLIYRPLILIRKNSHDATNST